MKRQLTEYTFRSEKIERQLRLAVAADMVKEQDLVT